MDKLDLFLIPLVYLFRMTLTLISLAIFLCPTPSSMGQTVVNGYQWLQILCIHPLRFALRWVHFLIGVPYNLVMQSSILRIITFWPKFYWSLFKPKPDRQSIWNILTNPEPLEGTKTKNVSNRMICLKDTYYCHSYYQVYGAYAHLNQRRENDLDEAVIEANTVMYYDDPLRISTPYEYLAKRLPRPPDGYVKATLSLGLIVLIYLIPILKGLITLWMRLVAAHLFKNDARC